MKHSLAATCILTATMIAGGCATKKYVRNTTAPIQAKVDQVGEQTTKQGQAIEENKAQIKQVDENAQSGVSSAKEKAATADTHAGEAMTKANQASELASRNTQEINHLRSSVGQAIANLDDYKLQTEATVPFKFDKYALTDSAKEDLDKLATSVSSLKRYFISVEGFTDKTGSAQYNETLSRKRADSVVQYLVAKHDIPIYRIHMIGLGNQKEIDTGRTRAARAKNRRVEVKVFSADQAVTLSQMQQ